TIDLAGMDPRLGDTTVEVACDVESPFDGPEGAARVFAPQKGADAAAVERLDAGLASVAGVYLAATGVGVRSLPAPGAARGAGGRAEWPRGGGPASSRAPSWCSTRWASTSASTARASASRARGASTSRA